MATEIRKDIVKNTLGVILIALGIAIIIWGAFGFKTREKVLDVGPVQATKETRHNLPYGPIVGAIVLISGVALVIAGRR
jgi:uncharacterized membrane protein YidH (DUF202 family)